MLNGGLLWSTAVFMEDSAWSPGDPLDTISLLLDSKERGGAGPPVHTRADPFLIALGDVLYLFLESQPVAEQGRIEAYRFRAGRGWEPLGEILKEHWHLSYPHVFEESGTIYMIPESEAAGQVTLHAFESFPYGPKPVRQLLEGTFADTSAVKISGYWYLFTTSPRGLEIYFSDDLRDGVFQSHPANPISNDPGRRRCGGAPLLSGDSIFRFAQDGRERYGGNLNVLEISAISPTDYQERLHIESLFDRSHGWNALGGHHMSAAHFQGRTFVAVDGLQRDSLFNRLKGIASRAAERIAP